MKKYRFELEPILEIREDIERKRQAELAEIRHILRQNIEDVEDLHNTKERVQHEFLDMQLKKSDQKQRSVHEYIQYYEYLCGIERKIEEQSKHIEEIREKEEVRRNSLEEASKDKRVIEEFKKQDYKEFLNEFNKFEQKLVDEMATISYNLVRSSKSLEKW